MEKRLFLAFIFSFLFLTLWAKVTTPPISKQPVRKTAAVESSLNINIPVDDFHSAKSVPDAKPAGDEKIQILENSKIRVEFSNFGGTIKKIFIKEYRETLPVTNIITVGDFGQSEFQLNSISENKIVYVSNLDGNKIRKTYELSGNDYTVFSNVEMSKEKKINMYTLDISRMDKKSDQDNSLFEYSVSFPDKMFRKSSAFKFDIKENKSENKQASWFGFRDRYFALIVKPEYEFSGYNIIVENDKKINFLTVPRETGNDRQEYLYKSIIFFGPQKKEAIVKAYAGFEKIISYSDWGILDAPAKLIYEMLIFVHKLVPNWGLAIIILGVLIYLITYPLTLAGLSSMRKMQSLQPQMTEMREKYKNNPQKLNQEMMELYKEHKVNPLGGCLPMIIQMPIFIGLYQVLWRSVVLKGEKFLWIQDLSLPDRIFVLRNGLPLIGTDFNLLPIVMAIVMGIQQKYSTKAMNVTDEAQLQQQKMMLWMLPGMMLLIFYKAASGLTLYFTILYMMTAFTQWKMSKLTR